MMDGERRRQALTLFLYYLHKDIESEKKAVAGMQNLMDAYSRQPDYADREVVEDTRLQARQVCPAPRHSINICHCHVLYCYKL